MCREGRLECEWSRGKRGLACSPGTVFLEQQFRSLCLCSISPFPWLGRLLPRALHAIGCVEGGQVIGDILPSQESVVLLVQRIHTVRRRGFGASLGATIGPNYRGGFAFSHPYYCFKVGYMATRELSDNNLFSTYAARAELF